MCVPTDNHTSHLFYNFKKPDSLLTTPFSLSCVQLVILSCRHMYALDREMMVPFFVYVVQSVDHSQNF